MSLNLQDLLAGRRPAQAPVGPGQLPSFGASDDLTLALNRRLAETGGRSWTMSSTGIPEASPNRMLEPRPIPDQAALNLTATPAIQPRSFQPQRFAMNSRNSPSPERGVSSPTTPYSTVMMSPSQMNFEQRQEGLRGQGGGQTAEQINVLS